MEVLDPANTGTIAIVILVAQLIGKVIPDGSGGVLGVIRSAAKFIGLYVQNRK